MKQSSFEEGDVVTLKSDNNIKMTISKISNEQAICHWYIAEQHEFVEKELPLIVLEMVDASPTALFIR